MCPKHWDSLMALTETLYVSQPASEIKRSIDSIYTKSMLRTVVLPPHPQPLSQRARGARKTFKVTRPQGEGFRERKTPGFELDKV
jgi:hypothetical protein